MLRGTKNIALVENQKISSSEGNEMSFYFLQRHSDQ